MSSTSSGVQFTLIEAISVTGISPFSWPIGSSAVITGTGFGSAQSNSTVNFYGTASAPTITTWSDSSITATAPTGTVTGPVSVSFWDACRPTAQSNRSRESKEGGGTAGSRSENQRKRSEMKRR
jgi:hypothetical protein